jgi:hypothetical protein
MNVRIKEYMLTVAQRLYEEISVIVTKMINSGESAG